MNSIFGIYSLNNQRTSRSAIIAMSQGHHLSCFQHFLTSHIALGRTYWDHKNDSVYSYQERTIVAKARIDNRKALFSKLNIGLKDIKNISNEQLLLYAYLKWGADMPKYIKGCWAFAIWDEKKKSLFIARDQSVQSSLYYYISSDYFLFSSTLKGLINCPLISKELEHRHIYTHNATPGNDKTLYKNIFQLTSANALIFSKSGGINKWCYHELNLEPIYYANQYEYSEAFLEIYNKTVENSIHGSTKTGITLSSGLDSGSIATLAAQQLKQQNRKLYSFSFVPVHDASKAVPQHRFPDETEGIKAIAQQAGNIETCFVKNRSISYIESFKKALDILHIPVTANIDNWNCILRKAKEYQIDTLLVGQHGNFTVSNPGFFSLYMRELLAKGKLVECLSELKEWKKEQNLSWSSIVKSNIMMPLLPKIFHAKWQMSKLQKSGFIQQKHIDDKLREAESIDNFYQENRSLIKNQKHIVKNRNLWNEFGEVYGLDIQDPTADRELMEFCLRIPQSAYIHKGNNKMLLKNAMEGLMPKEILGNKKRGLHGADLVYKAREQRDEIGDTFMMVRNSPLCRHYLNISKMEHIFAKLDDDTHIIQQYHDMLTFFRGVQFGLFLLRFERGTI